MPALDHDVREVIALVEDLPEGAEPTLRLDYEIHTGDPELDAATAKVRAEREKLRHAERELAEQTMQLVRRMRRDWAPGAPATPDTEAESPRSINLSTAVSAANS